MSDGQARRPYRSPLRDMRAQTTRRSILDSAQRLMAERGYGATTMRDIAEDAGVAVQTIYSSTGSKREILTAFIDQIEDDAQVAAATYRFLATDDPREHLRLRAELSRQIFAAGIDVIEMLIQSQGTSPDILDIIEEGDGRHRRSIKDLIVDRWADEVIRDDLTRDEAIDAIATLSGVDVYRWVVRRYSWPENRYETWLYRSLVELVLNAQYQT